MGRYFTPEQRSMIAEIGRASSLMGLRQIDAAARATEVLGVPVSQASVSRAILTEPAVEEAAKAEPGTLFDWANMETSAQIVEKLDEIIRLMKGTK